MTTIFGCLGAAKLKFALIKTRHNNNANFQIKFIPTPEEKCRLTKQTLQYHSTDDSGDNQLPAFSRSETTVPPTESSRSTNRVYLSGQGY